MSAIEILLLVLLIGTLFLLIAAARANRRWARYFGRRNQRVDTKQVDGLVAIIEQQRDGTHEIHLERGTQRYYGTYAAHTRWGAERTARRLLRNERKYLTEQTEWKVTE